MKEGDVILAALPHADGNTKNRPAIVLREMPSYRDLLVCGVSTQLHQRVEGFDDLLHANADDFRSSGLLADSVIRLGFLAVLPRRAVIGTIGTISAQRHRRLLERLSAYLVREASR